MASLEPMDTDTHNAEAALEGSDDEAARYASHSDSDDDASEASNGSSPVAPTPPTREQINAVLDASLKEPDDPEWHAFMAKRMFCIA